jgi:hypothetical protein
MLLLILAQGIFADWIAHLLLAATSAINWAEPPAVGLAGSFVGGEGEGFEPPASSVRVGPAHRCAELRFPRSTRPSGAE